ncbi:MAG: hypothetical protein ACKVOJ_14250 [Sphingomonadaceae bacterium]
MATDGSVSTLLPPLDVPKRTWTSWLSAAISVALLISIGLHLERFGFARAWSVLPTSPYFWTAFAGYYLALPFSEWLIYRRLWGIPFDGFAALLRKLVSNEILLGYSGEVYFYTWARRRAQLVTAPFGAIKDVSIMSALAGNLVTLTMLVVAYPMIEIIKPQFNARAVFLSAAFIITLSMLFFFFRRQIFSLPRHRLWFIFGMHMARLFVTTSLTVALWHLGLPHLPVIWLVMLVTLQLLVTRLPFVTNKEIVFASLAVFLVGSDAQIAALIAMIATAILATHIFVGALLAVVELFAVRRA